MSVTGKQIADAALSSNLIGTPYSKLDCQALVEKVLHLAGLNIINYRGSNHMWRELVHSPFNRADTNQKILPGMLAFIVRYDGGEKKRGYHDNYGNATHVAICLDDKTVFESTAGGVQISSNRRFTDFARIIDVIYSDEPATEPDTDPDDDPGTTITSERIDKLIEIILNIADELEDLKNAFNS